MGVLRWNDVPESRVSLRNCITIDSTNTANSNHWNSYKHTSTSSIKTTTTRTTATTTTNTATNNKNITNNCEVSKQYTKIERWKTNICILHGYHYSL